MKTRDMGTIQQMRIFIVISVIICYTSGINGAACKTGCPASSTKAGKLNYLPGNVYKYDLNSVLTVYLAGNDAQETKIQLQGRAEVYAEANCNFAVRIPDLTITGPDNKKTNKFPELHMNKVVRFTMANDELATEICADDDDTEYGLNVKRAVISMLQSASTKSYETDVFGTCPTTFATTQSGDTTFVTKMRNLNACGYRETLSTGLITGIFDESSGVKSTPLLNGDYTCEQTIKDGIVERAQVNEEYNFVPYSSGEAGARSKIVTKFTFKEKAAGKADAQKAGGRPRTILFENPHVETIKKFPEGTLKAALVNAVDQFKEHVGSKAAGQFTELIRLMRFANRGELLLFYNNAYSGKVHANKELARSIYLDALFRTGTSDSVQAIAELMRELSEKEKRLAYLSLNLVNGIKKVALPSVNKLLDSNPPKEAYLSIGNLVNKYCQTTGCESSDIKSVLDKFTNKLGDCKATDHKREDLLVAVLKGIRNTNHLNNPDKVIQCTTDKQSVRVRVAALQTLAAAACNRKAQQTALTLLKNHKIDSELRIEAYLMLVACPSGNLANEIKAMLDAEPVYQVGSFITSHLASLRSSTDPYRESARHHFANIRTTQKFPSDFRQYSFNHEYSYAMGSLGLGASVDTSVLYSQHSFLPRSARLNVTGEIFGNSFNVFELHGRQENLELLMEHNFGPKGLFKTATAQELYDLFAKKDGGGGGGRKRRSISRNDINQFAKGVKMGAGLNEALSDIELDVSMKLFGTEMYFLSLADNLPLDPKEFIRKGQQMVKKALTSAKGFDEVFECHTLFLDAELVYPTGAGFPLKLVAQGTSGARFETSGTVDIAAIVDKPKAMTFKVKTVPSFNIDVTGTLSIDGYVVTTGYQVSGSVHSSTGAEIDFKILNDGKGFDANLRLPLKKQEIFTFSHNIVSIMQERGQPTVTTPLKFTSKDQKFGGCFDQLNRFIGVTVCSDVTVTMPASQLGVAPFPLNGPNHASIWLEVDSGYHLNALLNDDNPKHQFIEMKFDTPGSQEPRDTTVKMELSTEPTKMFVKGSLAAPSYHMTAEAGLINDDTQAIAYVKHMNMDKEYSAELGFKKGAGGGGTKQTYTPIAQIRTPNKNEDNINGYKVTGTITVDGTDKKRTYTFNKIEISGPAFGKPFSINGYVAIDGDELSTDMKFAQDKDEGNVEGKFKFQPGHVIFELGLGCNTVDYANGKVALEIAFSDTTFKNDMTFVYGKDFKSANKRMELHQDYEFAVADKKITALKMKNKLMAPFAQTTAKVDAEYNQKLVKYDVTVAVAKHTVDSALEAKFNVKAQGDYDVMASGKFNEHEVKVKMMREIQSGRSKVRNRLDASTGTQLELNAEFGHEPTRQNADIHVDGMMVAAKKEEPYKFNFLLKATPKKVDSNGKLIIGSADIIAYDIKVIRSDDKRDGQFTFTMKDLLTGNGNFKSVAGKGDGQLLIDMPTMNRKMKIDSVFTIAAPVYDMKHDFYYDYEKDNAKKITFDTKNKATRSKVNSINTLDVMSEKFKLNFDAEHTGTLTDGTQSGKFTLVLPTDRQISGESNREFHMKGNAVHGNVIGKLMDQLPSKKQRTLAWDMKLTDGDIQAKLFKIIHQLEYVDFDGKNAMFSAEYKHLPNGHFKAGSAGLTAKGTLLPEVIDLLVSADEYCEEHAVYRVTAKYGGQFNINVNGNYHMGNRAKPYTYEMQTAVSIPNTQVKQLKFQSSGKVMQPQTDDGLYEGEFKVSGTLNDKTVSADTTAKGNAKHGSGHFKLSVPDVDPISFDASYAQDSTEDNGHYQGTLEARYGKGKAIKGSGDVKLMGHNEVNVHGTLQTPFENARNVDVSYKLVKSNENTYSVQASGSADDKLYKMTSIVAISDVHPSVDIVIVYPGGKDLKFQTGFDRLADRKYKGHVHVENFGDFNLAVAGETSYQNAENFYWKFDLDSAKLKMNKVHVEVKSKPNSGGKGVEFKALANDKNLFSGSADYTVKENGKTEIEGHGNVKLYDQDQQKTANFVLRKNNDKGDGISLIFNANVGGVEKVNANLVVNPKNFQITIAACEENNKCYKFEVKSIFRQSDVQNLDHELFILVDLLQLGFDKEFHLKADTVRNPQTMKHDFEMRLKSKDNIQYVYRVYVDPTKANIELVLPKRTMALEGVYRMPSKDIFGRYEATITSYLDKVNQPDKKATIGFVGDVTSKDRRLTTKGELKFSHPALKPMRITGQSEFSEDDQKANARLEVDIFKQANQAIILTGNFGNNDIAGGQKSFNVSYGLDAQSKGLGFEYSFSGHAAGSLDRRQVSCSGLLVAPMADLRLGAFMFGGDDRALFIVTGFNEEMIHVDGSYDANKAHVKGTVKILGAKPIVGELKATDYRAFKASLVGNQMNANAELTLGKGANMVIVGDGKELFTGKVTLDQTHFLASEYKVHEEELKAFVKSAQARLKADAENAKKEVTTRMDKVQIHLKAQGENLKSSIPDFTTIQAEYKEQVQKMVDEMMADKTIKEFVEFFKRFYGTFGKTIGEIINVLTENFTKVHQILSEFYDKMHTAFNEKILPALKETLANMEGIVTAIYEETVRLFVTVVERLLAVLKTFEADLSKVTAYFTSALQKFSAIFNKFFEYASKEIKDIYALIVDALREMPGLDYVKDKFHDLYGKMTLPDNVVHVIKDITNTIKELLPTQDFKEFVEHLAKYIENKLTNKKVDDIAELKSLYVELMKAIKSIVSLIRDQYNAAGGSGAAGATHPSSGLFYHSAIPFSLDALKRLPYLSTLKFSPWNYVRNEQFQSVRDLIHTYRPYGFNPANFWPPFDKHATIADGQHIFTFDGKHLTFPGTCSYVLSQDFINNNYSVVAQLDGGKLKSIMLFDKGDMVEVQPNGVVQMNGKPIDLPMHKDSMHVWRMYYSVQMYTDYGVFVICTLDMRVCQVSVNGYYHGKIRGLLGNGNSEPYDDFTLPDGQMAENFADFGNAYRMQAACAAVPFSDHHDHTGSDVCNRYFGSDSSMSDCYHFIRPQKYREACEHAVGTAPDKDDAACNIAMAYVSACRLEKIPVHIPDTCAQCHGADDKATVSVGESFPVTVPQKKADIVVVVDTSLDAQLTELVQPAIAQLRQELKLRDINDVHVTVIGYNRARKYLNLYTANGKMDFGPKTKISDDGQRYDKPIKTGRDDWDAVINQIYGGFRTAAEDFHMSADGRAFRRAMEYPYRSGATKAIIAVRSDGLTYSMNPTKALGALLVNSVAQVAGIQLHLIGPISDAPKDVKGVVIGFNDQSILSMELGKKAMKPIVTAAEQGNIMNFDLGVDMVLGADGYVFNTDTFGQLKGPADKKRFITMMTAAMAEQMARTEVTSDCECELAIGMFPVAKCDVKETKMRPPTKRANARG